MKKIILIITLIVATISCNSNNNSTVSNKKKNDLECSNIKGKVKSIEYKHYAANKTAGKVEKGEYLRSTIVDYDENGNVTQVKSYSSIKSIPISKYVYKYDSNNNRLEITHFTKDVLEDMLAY